ncbi:MAG: ribose 5-phosphate isomerase B [Desulfobacterales bacterium]|nr:ribose 5-phosphate isomerase B [Desulfobacterales bacterium]
MCEQDQASKSSIVIGCDHAAYKLKEAIKFYLNSRGYKVDDVGTNSENSVHYPEFAIEVAKLISKGQYGRGILLCGTGLGMSMVANRFKKVRAALCHDIFSARLSRLHNNANVLVMGSRVIGEGLALEIVATWLETPFEGERHQVRIDMFDHLQPD